MNQCVAARLIKNNMYVDDYSKSYDSVDAAATQLLDLMSIPKDGGFMLQGLPSNHNEFTNKLPPEPTASGLLATNRKRASRAIKLQKSSACGGSQGAT